MQVEDELGKLSREVATLSICLDDQRRALEHVIAAAQLDFALAKDNYLASVFCLGMLASTLCETGALELGRLRQTLQECLAQIGTGALQDTGDQEHERLVAAIERTLRLLINAVSPPSPPSGPGPSETPTHSLKTMLRVIEGGLAHDQERPPHNGTDADK